VVDLTGSELADRPPFFDQLVPQLCELRGRTARPHWLVVDEAHHVLPPMLGSASVTLPRELVASILITVRPEHVAPAALDAVGHMMTIGAEAGLIMRSFCERT